VPPQPIPRRADRDQAECRAVTDVERAAALQRRDDCRAGGIARRSSMTAAQDDPRLASLQHAQFCNPRAVMPAEVATKAAATTARGSSRSPSHARSGPPGVMGSATRMRPGRRFAPTSSVSVRVSGPPRTAAGCAIYARTSSASPWRCREGEQPIAAGTTAAGGDLGRRRKAAAGVARSRPPIGGDEDEEGGVSRMRAESCWDLHDRAANEGAESLRYRLSGAIRRRRGVDRAGGLKDPAGRQRIMPSSSPTAERTTHTPVRVWRCGNRPSAARRAQDEAHREVLRASSHRRGLEACGSRGRRRRECYIEVYAATSRAVFYP